MEASPLDEFLASAPTGRRTRCKVCDNDKIRAIVDEFMARLGRDDPSVRGTTVCHLVTGLLNKRMGFSIVKGTVYGHVERCLRLDKLNGKPLPTEPR